jgi:hypothetical protein
MRDRREKREKRQEIGERCKAHILRQDEPKGREREGQGVPKGRGGVGVWESVPSLSLSSLLHSHSSLFTPLIQFKSFN